MGLIIYEAFSSEKKNLQYNVTHKSSADGEVYIQTEIDQGVPEKKKLPFLSSFYLAPNTLTTNEHTADFRNFRHLFLSGDGFDVVAGLFTAAPSGGLNVYRTSLTQESLERNMSNSANVSRNLRSQR